MRSGRRDRAQGTTVAGICSLKQLTMKFSVGEETREAKIGWGVALCPSSLCESPAPPVHASLAGKYRFLPWDLLAFFSFSSSFKGKLRSPLFLPWPPSSHP